MSRPTTFKRGVFEYRGGSNLVIKGDLRVEGALEATDGVDITEPFTFEELVTMEASLALTGATTPGISITDTTNTVVAVARANDTVAQFGASSNHGLNLVANDVSVLAISSSGAVTIPGTLVVTGAATFTLGAQDTPVARTATADGLTTGTIAAGTAYVTVTSGNATDIIKLPTAVAGNKIRLFVGANGCLVETPAAGNATINGVDADGTNSLTLAANSYVEFAAVSTSAWVAFGYDADGVALTLLPT